MDARTRVRAEPERGDSSRARCELGVVRPLARPFSRTAREAKEGPSGLVGGRRGRPRAAATTRCHPRKNVKPSALATRTPAACRLASWREPGTTPLRPCRAGLVGLWLWRAEARGPIHAIGRCPLAPDEPFRALGVGLFRSIRLNLIDSIEAGGGRCRQCPESSPWSFCLRKAHTLMPDEAHVPLVHERTMSLVATPGDDSIRWSVVGEAAVSSGRK
jgi:hypothetical protein